MERRGVGAVVMTQFGMQRCAGLGVARVDLIFEQRHERLRDRTPIVQQAVITNKGARQIAAVPFRLDHVPCPEHSGDVGR